MNNPYKVQPYDIVLKEIVPLEKLGRSGSTIVESLLNAGYDPATVAVAMHQFSYGVGLIPGQYGGYIFVTESRMPGAIATVEAVMVHWPNKIEPYPSENPLINGLMDIGMTLKNRNAPGQEALAILLRYTENPVVMINVLLACGYATGDVVVNGTFEQFIYVSPLPIEEHQTSVTLESIRWKLQNEFGALR